MFTPDELDRIAFAPAQPEKVAPGYHTPVAEEFRQTAIFKLMLMHVLGGTLKILVREHPDDDERFDTVAASFVTAMREAGEYVSAFRNTRDVIGEA